MDLWLLLVREIVPGTPGVPGSVSLLGPNRSAQFYVIDVGMHTGDAAQLLAIVVACAQFAAFTMRPVLGSAAMPVICNPEDAFGHPHTAKQLLKYATLAEVTRRLNANW